VEPEEQPPPRLADETRWYTEHTALVISTLKWALFGAVAGLCTGFGTRAFLWALASSDAAVRTLLGTRFQPAWLLPLALPLCVFLVRRVAPTAGGEGVEAVIQAVHERSGHINWKVAPVKLLATVLTLAFGGSVGKEGPCAQIGAAISSMFADLFRLSDVDRRRLVICGISGGFAAVFGTPISGALFGIEVLYLGHLEYALLFPCLVSGIVAHFVSGVRPPVGAFHDALAGIGRPQMFLLSIVFGMAFGLIALVLIESMRAGQRFLRRFEGHPYRVAFAGGVALAALYALVGPSYGGLGTETIEAALAGSATIAALAFLYKIVATTVSLETGGSGGIVTPLFFIGATSGAVLARLLHLPAAEFAAFGFVSLVAAAANTPVAGAVMAIEILPGEVGIYAALAAGTAFLMVGHRSVHASQKIGLSKSAGLDVPMEGSIGDLTRSGMHVTKGSLTERALRLGNRRRPGKREGD
jgi:H+/Cl- antiporter ClcA